MKNQMKSAAFVVLALAIVVGFAAPAFADRDDGRWGDRDWRAHEIEARRFHYIHRIPPAHIV